MLNALPIISGCVWSRRDGEGEAEVPRGHREPDLQPLPCTTCVSVTPVCVTASPGNPSVIPVQN